MISFTPQRDRSQAPPLVQQIVDSVARGVEEQTLRPGMALPSVREFARTYGISTFTVATAYARLVSQGWLNARPGAGYRVAPRGRAGEPSDKPPAWEPPTPGSEWLVSDVFADHSIPIKSGCGWLPAEWLNEAGLHTGLRRVARVPAGQISGYGHPYGHAALRESIAEHAATLGMSVQASQVLMTQGVTHGLDLVVRTLLRAGDTVLVEQPCYANLLQLLRLAGLRVIGVPRTPEGLDTAVLEQAATLHRPKALFVTTVLQNPTGTSFAMANAFQALRCAERHGMWVVEDDISRALHPGVAPVLTAMEGARRSIYLSGYSKVVGPSVRVGYLIAHPDVVRDIARTKMIVGLTSPEIMERVVHQALREGRYDTHMAGLRERLAMAHAKVGALLAEHGMQAYTEPRAGLFLWARLPEKLNEAGAPGSANALAERALRDGIWLAPGSYFDVAGEDVPWIRLNVAYSEGPELWRFLRSYTTKS
jgi:DNA-binding transcriptional MocR family regulator